MGVSAYRRVGVSSERQEMFLTQMGPAERPVVGLLRNFDVGGGKHVSGYRSMGVGLGKIGKFLAQMGAAAG
jgi:hypothetical protein